MKIELSDKILVYTGRSRGQEDRAKYKLPDLDRADTVVDVIVPARIYSMTSSYFLGLFGDSIRKLGREEFLKRYRVHAPPHVQRKLDDWIARALREKKGLLGGDV